MPDDAPPFPYMRWAKACLDPLDPLSLGLSGLPRPGAAARAPLLAALADPPADAEGAWVEALARRLGVEPGRVHPASGTSHANFLVWLAFARGGRVVVEAPAYEALPRLGQAVGARLATFPRRIEDRWALDPAGLEAAVAGGADLIAVTDLHNPSGVRMGERDWEVLLAAAEAADALVLVDEVYRELDPQPRPTAALRHPRILATGSLTKAHGLSELRAGWVVGSPDAIRSVASWDDLVCPRLPAAAFVMARAWLERADDHLAVAIRTSAARTAVVDAWVRSRDDVRWVPPDGGFTGFVRLGRGEAVVDDEQVAARAWSDERVRVVPGRFFQSPGWLRLSWYLPEDALRRALDGLGRTLDRVTRG